MIGKASKKLLVIITSVIMIVFSLVNVTYPLAQGEVEISRTNFTVKDWIDESTNTYNFPITTYSNYWKSLKTSEEMFSACTIPSEILKKISTEELVNIVLNYPLLCNLFAYNTYQQGFDSIRDQFNGLNELLIRNDSSTILLDLYQNTEIKLESFIPESRYIEMDEANIEILIEEIQNSSDLSDKVRATAKEMLSIVMLEVLLAQDEIQNNLSDDNLNVLNIEALEKYKTRNNSKIYKGLESPFYETLMEDKNKILLGDYSIQKNTEDSKTSIITPNAYITTVKTPKGTSVSVIVNDYFGMEATISLTESFKTSYPNATFKEGYGATNMYNCHSYAWFSQNQTLTDGYWMNSPYAYVTDGSYSQVGTSPTANNQKVLWINAAHVDYYIHSGIVTNYSTTTITSKWGQGPVMIHSASYSPYSGTRYYYK